MDVSPVHLAESRPQRAFGRLDLAFKHEAGITRLATLHQSGCLKARFPRPADPRIPEAVTLNISGGIAGGDMLHTAVTLAPNAAALIASQSAERVYRSLGPAARIGATITLGAGASLDYLPQETILFDQFALARGLTMNLAASARFLGVESLIFGRRSSNETIHDGTLSDRITLNREGRRILTDITQLSGDIAAALARPAIAGGATAVATIIYAAPDAETRLPALRAALAASSTAGASFFDGIILARILAPSAISLRHCLLPALATLRHNRPPPRVWQA